MKDYFCQRFIAYCVIVSLGSVVVIAQDEDVFCSLNLPRHLGAAITSSKVLTSPGFPRSYPEQKTCRWIIRAPNGLHVKLNFIEFKMNDDTEVCTDSSDTLLVYNSNIEGNNLLGKYCGSYLPATVISSGRYLYLKFITRASKYQSGQLGFRLNYKAVIDSDGSSTNSCSPFNSYDLNNKIKLVASDSYQEITSPLYPNKYPSSLQCSWQISLLPKEDENDSYYKRIELRLTEFEIYNYMSKSYLSCNSHSQDFLKVIDGPSIGYDEIRSVCTPQSVPTTIMSTGGYDTMTIQFHTNNDNYLPASKARFKLQYREVKAPLISNHCWKTLPFEENNNIKLSLYSDEPISINSPGYPYQYPASLQCTWYIYSRSGKIDLTLSSIKIHNRDSKICSRNSTKNDYLTIIDGPKTSDKVLRTFCDFLDKTTTIVTTGSYVTIRFKTDADNYFTDAKGGFMIKIDVHTYSGTMKLIIVVVCVLVGIVVVSLLIIYYIRKKRKSQNARNMERLDRVPSSDAMALQPAQPPAPQHSTQNDTIAEGSSTSPLDSKYPLTSDRPVCEPHIDEPPSYDSVVATEPLLPNSDANTSVIPTDNSSSLARQDANSPNPRA